MKRQHLSPVFSPLINCLATKPRYATNRPNKLTRKFSHSNSPWIALIEKMLGKSSSGKVVLCWSTFTYHFDTCYKDSTKMRVWALSRLQIESPIHSEKDFQPLCSFKFLINEMTQLLIFDKNFFSKSCTSKLGVRLICECGLYAGIYGMLILGFETFCFQSPCFSNKYGLFLASQGKNCTQVCCKSDNPSNQKSLLHSIFNTGRFTGEV